jgi:chromosome segregation ATPase
MLPETITSRNYREELSQAFGTVTGKMPTFDKSLDRYFDAHFSAIIEEWGLLTTQDLQHLEGRLSAVSLEIDRLTGARNSLEERARDLEREIAALEESRGA